MQTTWGHFVLFHTLMSCCSVTLSCVSMETRAHTFLAIHRYFYSSSCVILPYVGQQCIYSTLNKRLAICLIIQKVKVTQHHYRPGYDLRAAGGCGSQIPRQSAQEGVFFVITPTRCTNFINLFWHENLYVSDTSSDHHQEFIHSTLSNGVCHTSL
jgi:hypothetical protein